MFKFTQVEIARKEKLSEFIDLEANIGYYFVASASPSGDCDEKIHLGVRVDDTIFTESQLGYLIYLFFI